MKKDLNIYYNYDKITFGNVYEFMFHKLSCYVGEYVINGFKFVIRSGSTIPINIFLGNTHIGKCGFTIKDNNLALRLFMENPYGENFLGVSDRKFTIPIPKNKLTLRFLYDSVGKYLSKE